MYTYTYIYVYIYVYIYICTYYTFHGYKTYVKVCVCLNICNIQNDRCTHGCMYRACMYSDASRCIFIKCGKEA